MYTTVAALVLLATTPVPDGRVVLVAGEGLIKPFGVDFDDAGNVYVVEMSDDEPLGRRDALQAGAGLTAEGGGHPHRRKRARHHRNGQSRDSHRAGRFVRTAPDVKGDGRFRLTSRTSHAYPPEKPRRKEPCSAGIS